MKLQVRLVVLLMLSLPAISAQMKPARLGVTRGYSTLPASSSTQYQLERSLRSSPTVNFCCEIFLLSFIATVLTFFIAGLLYLLCLKHVDNLGAYSIPSGDRPSHPI